MRTLGTFTFTALLLGALALGSASSASAEDRDKAPLFDSFNLRTDHGNFQLTLNQNRTFTLVAPNGASTYGQFIPSDRDFSLQDGSSYRQFTYWFNGANVVIQPTRADHPGAPSVLGTLPPFGCENSVALERNCAPVPVTYAAPVCEAPIVVAPPVVYTRPIYERPIVLAPRFEGRFDGRRNEGFRNDGFRNDRGFSQNNTRVIVPNNSRVVAPSNNRVVVETGNAHHRTEVVQNGTKVIIPNNGGTKVIVPSHR